MNRSLGRASVALLFLWLVLSATGCLSGPKPLLRPNGVALAPDGSLYVMARGNYRVAHLARDGRLLGAFGKLGAGPNDIYFGRGMALDPAGNVYFCNLRYDAEGSIEGESVKVLAPNGRLLRELVAPEDEGYDGCNDVHIDRQGRVWVAFNLSDQVRVFGPQGQRLATLFGETGAAPGQFNGLQGLAVDSQRGLLYASDSVNSRIQQFDMGVSATGTFSLTHRLSFGSYGRGAGQFAYPGHLAVDEATGELYVGDMANRRIQVFSPAGKYLREFAPPDVSLWHIQDLLVGPDGLVYAVDALNNAIWVFAPDGQLRDKIEVRR